MVHGVMNTFDKLKTKFWGEQTAVMSTAEQTALCSGFLVSVTSAASVATLGPDDGSWKIDFHGTDAENILRALKLRKTHKRMLAVCNVLEKISSERDDPDW